MVAGVTERVGNNDENIRHAIGTAQAIIQAYDRLVYELLVLHTGLVVSAVAFAKRVGKH